MTDYACVYIGEVLHAAQTQAALADVHADGRVQHNGWSICCKVLGGKLVRGRPDCAECLKACVVHEERVADGTARVLPLSDAQRVVVVATDESAATSVMRGAGYDVVVLEGAARDAAVAATEALKGALVGTGMALDEAALHKLAVDWPAAVMAQPATSQAGVAQLTGRADRGNEAAEDMIERLLIETPTLRNQALVDAVRKAGLKASFGRVDKVRERLGMREPAKPSKAPAPPNPACTPECLAGGPPCSAACMRELGLPPNTIIARGHGKDAKP